MVAPALRAAERDARVFSKMWRGSIVTMFLWPILMLLAMGIGLGDLVNDETPELDGLTYVAFITPALMVVNVVQTGIGFSMWPVMAGHRWLGFHRAMVASPLTPTAVLGGHLTFLAVRSLVMATVFGAVAALLGGIDSWWAVVALPVTSLAALAVSAPAAAHGARAEMDHSFDPIMRILVTPMVLFSGTFFPVEQLPVVLEAAVKVLPLWHGVELARDATTGTLDVGRTIGHLGVLLAYFGLGWLWARHEFTKRLTS
ncbi:MAG: ABC transporter permease [Actinomycetota bacterium]